MKLQLKYRITYGYKGDTAHARGEVEVYAFNIVQAIEFAGEMDSGSNKKITKVERMKE